ncbi:MAG: hypothetical protein ACPGKS_07920 [Coraliomargarita sp.]
MPSISQQTGPVHLRAILACCFLLPLLCKADQQTPGLAAVTNVRETIELIRANGKTTRPELHEIMPLSGSSIRSGAEANLVLSLSNGIGLALDENTSLTFGSYTQTPFSERQEGLQFEPSVSKLQLQLEEGLIAIAFEHLSPLSNAEVSLPMGTLKLHAGKILVSVASDGTCTISVLSGTATLNYANSREREFISAGQSAIVKDTVAQRSDLSSTPTDRLLLADAADYSRKRVLFRSQDASEGPAAIWVAPPDQLEKPPERPYSFEL